MLLISSTKEDKMKHLLDLQILMEEKKLHAEEEKSAKRRLQIQLMEAQLQLTKLKIYKFEQWNIQKFTIIFYSLFSQLNSCFVCVCVCVCVSGWVGGREGGRERERERERERDILLWHIDKHGVVLTATDIYRDR